jgi:hypothetical protein
LEHRETDYTVINSGLSIASQSAAFNKEPPAASGRVYRGVLRFGGSSSNAIPFLWQRAAGKLFLDLNRNQDLTDDPAGTFLLRSEKASSYQTFTNARLVLTTTAGRVQVLADINFWDYNSRPDCNLSLHSFWQGKVTLHGQDWQAGLIPNLSNQADVVGGAWLLLRPWQKQSQPFNANDNSLVAFPFSQKLFFGGHAYQVKSLPGSHDGDFVPALQFTDQSVALGDLKITGKFIRRLMLSGASYLAILDQPVESVKVPVGTYSLPNVLLEQNGVEAYCNIPQWQQPQTKISVDGKTPAILAAGGPLTNSVQVTRHGQNLRLDYRLLGAGGQAYQMATVNRSKPPDFAIYKGDKQIASGKFEFG